MLALQWNINAVKAAWQEEAREQGIGIGLERVAINMLRKGKSPQEIQEFTDLSIQRIQELKSIDKL